MGEFLENNWWIFQQMEDDALVSEQVAQILESGDYSDEDE